PPAPMKISAMIPNTAANSHIRPFSMRCGRLAPSASVIFNSPMVLLLSVGGWAQRSGIVVKIGVHFRGKRFNRAQVSGDGPQVFIRQIGCCLVVAGLDAIMQG